MAKSKIDKMIESICNEHKVNVLINAYFTKDYGECYPNEN